MKNRPCLPFVPTVFPKLSRVPPAAAATSSLEQPVETVNLEIWFPRLIVVPVYSQEVAGVRKEKERLTAAADSFSFIRTRAATLS